MYEYKEDKGAPQHLQTVEHFIIASLPSRRLREHLWVNSPEWSDYQKACLIRQYMDPYDGKRMLMQLGGDERFCTLLSHIIRAIEDNGDFESDSAQAYYERAYAEEIAAGKKSRGFLQDYVGLPVVYDIGDLVQSTLGEERKYAFVIKGLPVPTAECSDEFYKAEGVPLFAIEKDALKKIVHAGIGEYSIPVAFTDDMPESKLTDHQPQNYIFIKEILKP